MSINYEQPHHTPRTILTHRDKTQYEAIGWANHNSEVIGGVFDTARATLHGVTRAIGRLQQWRQDRVVDRQYPLMTVDDDEVLLI